MTHHSQHSPRARNLLRIDASARREDSVTRSLGDALVSALRLQQGELNITRRDLADSPPPFVDAAWVDATFTPEEQRSDAQHEVLAASDRLVDELMQADILMIGVPIYNFGVPASLKAWVDMVARARLTFRYTEQGAEGLLKGKHAWLVVASGGVPAGSELDFATGYLRHVLGFMGISDVQVIAADQLSQRGDEALAQAHAQINALAPAASAA